MVRCTWLVALAALAFAALGPGSGTMAAQTPWVEAGDGTSVVLEVYKPFLDGDEGFATSLWYATIYGRLSDRIRMVGELPFAYADLGGGSSEASLGNPYIGLEYATDVAGLNALAGIRLPTSSDNLGALVGVWTDLIDRPGNFGKEIVTLTAGVDYGSRGEDGLGFDAYFKPHLVIPIGEFGNNAELAFAYGGQVGYYDPLGSVSGGITGFWLAEGEDPLDAGLFQLGVSGQLNLGTLRPGAVIRVPLNDNYRLFTDFVLGFNLTVVPGG